MDCWIPECLLPVQGARPRASPEKRLLMAVLEDAIWTYRKYRDAPGTARQLADEAKIWLCGGPAHLPFEWVCAVLQLDPDAVRKAVVG